MFSLKGPERFQVKQNRQRVVSAYSCSYRQESSVVTYSIVSPFSPYSMSRVDMETTGTHIKLMNTDVLLGVGELEVMCTHSGRTARSHGRGLHSSIMSVLLLLAV